MNSKENSWRAEARYNENCLLINIFSQGHIVFSKITLRNKAGNVFEGSYESLSNRKMIAQVVYVSSDMMSFLLSEKD